MDRRIYRLNMCIDKNDHKQRIEVLEEIIEIAKIKIEWEKEKLKEEQAND
ncbi:MAG: hypothetical protein ACRCX2_04375 [Paraclostridium sp.]